MSSRGPSDSTEVRLRPVISKLPQYKPGIRLDASSAALQRKLSANEVPFEPLPEVVAVLTAGLGTINRYPDMKVGQLSAHLAEHTGLDRDWVAIGAGSVALLEHAIASVCDAHDEVIFAWRSFEAYPIMALRAGAIPIAVPLNSAGGHDLTAMLTAISPKTRIILICTPNNPTGTIVSAADLHRFLAAVPPDILVVIDEAYGEFVTSKTAAIGLDFLREYPNVILLRTFSKAYGLAGLRVGYALARPRIAAAIASVATPFGVSALAEAAACAALLAKPEVSRRVALIVAERRRISAELRSQGWDLPAAEGNFVWIPDSESTAKLVAQCSAQSIAVRYFPGDGVRITIGDKSINDEFLVVSQQVASQN